MLEYRSFSSKRRFGVEFEVSACLAKQTIGKHIEKYEYQKSNPKQVIVQGGPKGWAETNANEFWHVKYDSTCGPLGKGSDHGWEIVSYIGSGLKDIQDIANLGRYLSDCDLKTNENCGMHIHADVSDFSQIEMGNLHSHWLKMENMIIHSLPKHRKNNPYCKPVAKKFRGRLVAVDSNHLWNAIKPTNFYPHENPQKKIALNSLGFAHSQVNCLNTRNTLELRMPECILDPNYIQNWIILYLHFIDCVKSRNFLDFKKESDNPLEEALWILGLSEQNEDDLLILDEELFQAKCWFLQRLIDNASMAAVSKTADIKLDFLTQIS